MIIAHGPAGYIFTKPASYFVSEKNRKAFIFCGLFGSIAPDLDWIYSIFFDDLSRSHHSYWSHIPFYWLMIGIMFLPLAPFFKRTALLFYIFLSNVMIHLVLDTPVGGIQWYAPSSEEYVSYYIIPAVYPPESLKIIPMWLWSTFHHWYFYVEIKVCIFACAMFIMLFILKKLKAYHEKSRSEFYLLTNDTTS